VSSQVKISGYSDDVVWWQHGAKGDEYGGAEGQFVITAAGKPVATLEIDYGDSGWEYTAHFPKDVQIKRYQRIRPKRRP